MRDLEEIKAEAAALTTGYIADLVAEGMDKEVAVAVAVADALKEYSWVAESYGINAGATAICGIQNARIKALTGVQL